MNMISTSGLREIPTILMIPNGLYRLGVQSLLAQTVCKVLDHDPELRDLDLMLEELSEAGSMVVLVESSSDDPESLSNIKRARTLFVDGKIIVLAGKPNAEHLRDCLLAGANAYILPDATLENLNDSIRLVLDGQKIFPADLDTEGGLENENTDGNGKISINDLTETERMILSMLITGMSNKSMQDHFGKSVDGMKSILYRTLKKIGAKNRVQGAIWASNNGVRPFSADLASNETSEIGSTGARVSTA